LRPIILFLLLFAIPFSLPAQAWLFPKGEGTVSTSYQSTYVHDHLDYTGKAFSFGDIYSQAITVDTDYSLTDKLALRVALPYIFGLYSGDRPHPTAPDNGAWHSTFQNFTADLRYNVSQRSLVITPFVRLVMPSHGYESFGHAIVGRDVREYQIGTNIGRRLDPILPKAYLQAQYSYAFAERILGISPNRSNVEAQIGYFLTPRVSLLGSMQFFHTYNGYNTDFSLPQGGLTNEQFRHHDQIGKETLLNVGGGVSYAMNRKLEVYASWGRSVTGINGHLQASIVTIGVSRTFGTKFAEESTSLGTAQGSPPPNQAIICTCARGK